MNKEELAKVITGTLSLSRSMAAKERSIENLLLYGDKVLAECNHLFQRAEAFRKAPGNGRSAPIPAWQGNPTSAMANEGAKKIINLMDEASPLLAGFTAFRNRYRSFQKNFAKCSKDIMATFKKHGDSIDHATALKVTEPLRQLDRELDGIATSVPLYEAALKKIKGDLNALKEVN